MTVSSSSPLKVTMLKRGLAFPCQLRWKIEWNGRYMHQARLVNQRKQVRAVPKTNNEADTGPLISIQRLTIIVGSQHV